MKAFLSSMFLAVMIPASLMAAPAPAASTPAMLAYVGLVSGSVQAQLGGSDIWGMAKLGQALPAGTQIKTETGSSCTIAFSDGTKVRIGPQTTFKLEEASPSKVAVFIGMGKLEAWVKKLANRHFQARSPVAVASVRGTIIVMTESTITVFDGTALIQDNTGKSVLAGDGQEVRTDAATGVGNPQPTTETKPAEPVVTVAPPVQPQAAAPAAKPTPKPTVPAEQPQQQQETPQPNPKQETETPVSPSTP